MNPVLKSYLTSAAVWASGAVVTWAAAKGIVPQADQNELTNDIAGAAVFAIGAFLVWVKGQLASPSGLIKSLGASDPTAVKTALEQAPVSDQAAVNKAVNDARNGLKVVPATSTSVSAVNDPITSPKAN